MKRVVLLLQKKEHVSFAHKIISENTEKWTPHTINSKLFMNISPCVEKYLKDNKHNSLYLAWKEGSCHTIYNINLSGIRILSLAKGIGCQRLPIGLPSIIYWAKKNYYCRQPKLNIASGQIYCIISHHQYISTNRYADEWENYRGRQQDVWDLLSKCW